jgi:hypothetical protein
MPDASIGPESDRRQAVAVLILPLGMSPFRRLCPVI